MEKEKECEPVDDYKTPPMVDPNEITATEGLVANEMSNQFKLGVNGPVLYGGIGSCEFLGSGPYLKHRDTGKIYNYDDVVIEKSEERHGLGWPDIDVDIVNPDTGEVIESGVEVAMSGLVAYSFDINKHFEVVSPCIDGGSDDRRE